MAGPRVPRGGNAGRRIHRIVGRVGVVVGKVAFTGGLQGGDFRFCLGGGSVSADRAGAPEGEPGQNTDDRDDPEKLDQGEGRGELRFRIMLRREVSREGIVFMLVERG